MIKSVTLHTMTQVGRLIIISLSLTLKKLQKKIDEEISLIIEKQYKRACDILKKNKSKLSELAKRLLEKEVIFKEDLVKILGERPFKKDEQDENKK
jgi:ATP-dependent Zn protease